MRIYTIGPMSGYPEDNAPAFHAAADFLRKLGHDVVTPIELNATVWAKHFPREAYDPAKHQLTYSDPILGEMYAEDIHAVCTRDAVAVLPGWEKSRGGLRELAVATLLGKRIIDAETGLDIAVQVTVKGTRYTPPVVAGEDTQLSLAL